MERTTTARRGQPAHNSRLKTTQVVHGAVVVVGAVREEDLEAPGEQDYEEDPEPGRAEPAGSRL